MFLLERPTSGLLGMIQVFFKELKKEHQAINCSKSAMPTFSQSIKDAHEVNDNVEALMGNLVFAREMGQSLHQFFSDILSEERWKWSSIITSYDSPDCIALDWKSLNTTFGEILQFLHESSINNGGKCLSFSIRQLFPDSPKLLVTLTCPDVELEPYLLERHFANHREIKRMEVAMETNMVEGTTVTFEIANYEVLAQD